MELLNTKQAAERLGVSERRVRALILEGKLVAQNLGRDYVITEEALASVRVYGKPGRPPKAQEEEQGTKTSKKARKGSKQ